MVAGNKELELTEGAQKRYEEQWCCQRWDVWIGATLAFIGDGNHGNKWDFSGEKLQNE